MAPDSVADARGDQIIVTATRKETALQDTPIAIGVLGGEQIAEQRMLLVRDLSASVAGLQVAASTTPAYGNIYIRGIGTNLTTIQSPVGLYVDDIPASRITNRSAFGLPDVERIEVLRGPQGTLYGINNTGGAIRIISRAPSLTEASGSASISAGSFGLLAGDFYATAPIIEDELGASIAYSHRADDGYTYNAARKAHVNAIRTDQARFKLRYAPRAVEGLEINASAYLLRDRSDSPSFKAANYGSSDPYVVDDIIDTRSKNNVYQFALNTSYEIDGHSTVRSITGYRYSNAGNPTSYNGLPYRIFDWNNFVREKQFSQEFIYSGQFKNFDITAGAIYVRDALDVNRPSGTFGRYVGSISRTVSQIGGIYAEGRYSVTDQFGVTLGGRYFWQRDNFDIRGYESNAEFDVGPTIWSLPRNKVRHDGFTPKIGIDFKLSPDILFYASITKAQKSGGYFPTASSELTANVLTRPERVTSYEIGEKSSWLDGAIVLNLTGFYVDYRDYQTNLNNTFYNGQFINGTILLNARKSRVYGGEFELIAKPVRGLEARIVGSATKSEFQDFTVVNSTATTSYAGNSFPYQSPVSGSASLAYRREFDSKAAFSVRGEVKYLSKMQTDIANINSSRAQTYVNLDAQVTLPGGAWSVFGNVRNLLNNQRVLSSFRSVPGVYGEFYNPPRAFEVGARFTF